VAKSTAVHYSFKKSQLVIGVFNDQRLVAIRKNRMHEKLVTRMGRIGVQNFDSNFVATQNALRNFDLYLLSRIAIIVGCIAEGPKCEQPANRPAKKAQQHVKDTPHGSSLGGFLDRRHMFDFDSIRSKHPTRTANIG